MKKLLVSLAIFLLCSQHLRAQINQQKIDSLAQATLEYTGTVGAYISVNQDNSTIYSSAFGYNDLKEKTVLTDSTVFPIMSNTKAFNSILLAQLADQEKLDWNTPVKSYLPELAFQKEYITENITLTDLLTHRAGIPRYDFTYFMLTADEEKNPNKAVFEKLKFLEIPSFRTHFYYGNVQYILGAYLLEELTGEKWEDRLHTQILLPLGMQDTHTNLERFEQDANRAIGYQRKQPVSMDYVTPLYKVSGMGNMFSSVRDLEKWSRFLLNGDSAILSKQASDHTLRGQFALGFEEPYQGFSNVEYALGWFTFEYFGHKVVMHHGDNIGHQSMVVLLPEDNISWVIIANDGFGTASFAFNMTFALLDELMDQPVHDWNERRGKGPEYYFRYLDEDRASETKPSLKMKKYTGSYVHDGFGTIEVFMENGQLKFKAGDYTESLAHWENDTFRGYSEVFREDFLFKFELKAGKKVVGLETDLIEPTVGGFKFKKR